MLNILLIISALMLVFTNILFTWLLIKQLAGQNVESKIVTIGLIIICAVRPPLQERRGMSEANHSLSKCGDIRRYTPQGTSQ